MPCLLALSFCTWAAGAPPRRGEENRTVFRPSLRPVLDQAALAIASLDSVRCTSRSKALMNFTTASHEILSGFASWPLALSASTAWLYCGCSRPNSANESTFADGFSFAASRSVASLLTRA
jgi:hypothetical protein